ncbi:hypothetical protein H4R20_004838 [Coemansia guatemalensis]|uniref:F-box domain-containing protein n=1 Tax=Coemansia guatemalensis TaxID=2761395 RepID=A0A9W8HTW7_9FUNG|nr:hypothetical protein H4R20_004838 [Coemansia guatemalensis]
MAKQNAPTEERFGRMPTDILEQVLARVDAATLLEAGLVSRRWQAVASSDHSWRQAVQQRFGQRPTQWLQTMRMPGTAHGGWVGGGGARGWRGELVGRERLQAQWMAGARQQEFCARAGMVDAVVVSEQHGWALAVSCSTAAAVRCAPQKGRVYARDADTDAIVFAVPNGMMAASSVATRADRIMWGLPDGQSVATALTRGGTLKRRVTAQQRLEHEVLALAGAGDALAQHVARGNDDLVASASAGGAVLVWSAADGQTYRELHAEPPVPLDRVTWAAGERFVVAASSAAGLVFVWDLELQDRRPAATAAVPGDPAALVLLAGDPHAAAFVVVSESGATRMGADGTTVATFAAGDATLTAATWTVGAVDEPPLLALGNAAGDAWLFDGTSGAVLQHWPHLLQRAVAAAAVNAAVAVFAARDGHTVVVDVLSGRVLRAMRCRCGGRSTRTVDPWMWSVHPVLRTEQAPTDVQLTQQLAARDTAAWDRQMTAHIDALDRRIAAQDNVARLFAAVPRTTRFPTAVAAVAAGYGWVVAATGMHIHACFAIASRRPPPAPVRIARESHAQRMADGLAEARQEEDCARDRRLHEHALRSHIEREFEEPAAALGLTPDEQLAYALMLSADAPAPPSAPDADRSEPLDLGLSPDEQLAYALMLSADDSPLPPTSSPP